VEDVSCETLFVTLHIYEIMAHFMARPKKPLRQESPQMAVHTFTLTEDVVEMLRWLSSDATDVLGRTVSISAIVRALVRHVDHQGPPVADALFLLVEKEMKAGRVWGKKK
jgi:hypothetical protein